MLEETGTAYSENVIRTRNDMAQMRDSGKLMYGQVPMLEIDGLNIVQCDAILRYLARKHEMTGQGPAESVRPSTSTRALLASGSAARALMLLGNPWVM